MWSARYRKMLVAITRRNHLLPLLTLSGIEWWIEKDLRRQTDPAFHKNDSWFCLIWKMKGHLVLSHLQSATVVVVMVVVVVLLYYGWTQMKKWTSWPTDFPPFVVLYYAIHSCIILLHLIMQIFFKAVSWKILQFHNDQLSEYLLQNSTIIITVIFLTTAPSEIWQVDDGLFDRRMDTTVR